MHKTTKWYSTLVSISLIWLSVSVAWADDVPPGDWQLKLLDGRVVQPFSASKDKALVLIFVSPDCPIANAYHPQLAKMQEKFAGQGVGFCLIHSNRSTTLEQAKQHVQEYKIKLPVALDNKQIIAKRLSAKATPEVFVLADNQSDPVYHGKIDNLYEGYGKRRVAATKHYLLDSITAVLDGKTPAVQTTKPVGCFIEYPVETSETTPANRTITEQPDNVYDPSRSRFEIKIDEIDITDTKRKRTLPVRFYSPLDAPTPWPVIVLSHGLGGNRKACSYLGEHWSSRGYLVIALQHPGSDESVWKDKPRAQIMSNLKKAATGQNLRLRAEDVQYAIDELESWNHNKEHQFFQKLNLKKVGMAGHSFGAVTTQAIAGQKYRKQSLFQDKRVVAALPLSPSPARFGDTSAAFGHIMLPWLSITGTLDEAPIGGIQAQDRPKAYQALPAGDKYELVLNEATHYALGDTQMRSRDQPRNPAHHKAIESISAAFWDCYLRESEPAAHWIKGKSVRTLLDSKDQWRSK